MASAAQTSNSTPGAASWRITRRNADRG